MQVSQYLIFTDMPFTRTSLVREKCRPGVCLPPTSAECWPTSSSGGCVARGTIPGSRAEVKRRSANT